MRRTYCCLIRVMQIRWRNRSGEVRSVATRAESSFQPRSAIQRRRRKSWPKVERLRERRKCRRQVIEANLRSAHRVTSTTRTHFRHRTTNATLRFRTTNRDNPLNHRRRSDFPRLASRRRRRRRDRDRRSNWSHRRSANDSSVAATTFSTLPVRFSIWLPFPAARPIWCHTCPIRTLHWWKRFWSLVLLWTTFEIPLWWRRICFFCCYVSVWISNEPTPADVKWYWPPNPE